jgi:hypothetical protein
MSGEIESSGSSRPAPDHDLTAALMQARVRCREAAEAVEVALDRHLAGGEIPPTSPDASSRPFNLRDSARAIMPLCLALIGVGVNVAAVGPFPPRVTAMDGLTALRAGKLEAAEAKFRHDGNTLRLAETYIRQGKLDEASVLVSPLDVPAAIHLRGLIAYARGDRDAAMAQFHIAADRDFPAARAIIDAEGTQYAAR